MFLKRLKGKVQHLLLKLVLILLSGVFIILGVIVFFEGWWLLSLTLTLAGIAFGLITLSLFFSTSEEQDDKFFALARIFFTLTAITLIIGFFYFLSLPFPSYL